MDCKDLRLNHISLTRDTPEQTAKNATERAFARRQSEPVSPGLVFDH
jgi:hypothetical protein